MSKALKKGIARKTCGHLLCLLKKVKRQIDPYISIDQIRHLQIVVTDLSWEPEGTIDFEPRFCNPYPAEAFDTIFEHSKYGPRAKYKLKWREDLPQETSSRQEEAQSLAVHIAVFMGQPDSNGHIAAHGDWLRT